MLEYKAGDILKELSQEDRFPLGQLTIDKVRLIRLKTHRLDKS